MSRPHLATAEVDAYLARQLSASALLAASDHLAGCESCRASLERLFEAKRVSFKQQDVDPVSYEEMADWLDDQLDPLSRREVASKLSHSESARRELADLAHFRDRSSTESARDFSADLNGNRKILAFSRWVLPLAAAILLSAGALWWTQSRPRVDSGGLQALSPELRVPVENALRNGRIDLPAAVLQLRGKKEVLAGTAPANEFKILRPVATVVREARPRFQWQNFPGATSYRINIVDLETGELVASDQVAANAGSWTPTKPFAAGKTYEWEVEAWHNDKMMAKTPTPPQPEARFKILSADQSAELERIERQTSVSRLILGLTKAQFGLLDEAEAELETLTGKNQNAKLAGQLLEHLRRERETLPP